VPKRPTKNWLWQTKPELGQREPKPDLAAGVMAAMLLGIAIGSLAYAVIVVLRMVI
jgi:tetrahydromethanopterin S-methyltransferase subunit F